MSLKTKKKKREKKMEKRKFSSNVQNVKEYKKQTHAYVSVVQRTDTIVKYLQKLSSNNFKFFDFSLMTIYQKAEKEEKKKKLKSVEKFNVRKKFS